MSDISKDPIKSAIYNPKEFRQGRPQRNALPAARAPRQRKSGWRRWMALIVVAGLIGGGYYAWEQMQTKRAKIVPLSGEFQRFYPPTVPSLAPLKISAKESKTHFFVKLEDWRTAAPIVTVFIRQGEETAISVPLGEYRLKYASGANWLGPELLFGPTTQSSQAKLPMTFSIEGNQYRGHVLDLTPRLSGNLNVTLVGVRSF